MVNDKAKYRDIIKRIKTCGDPAQFKGKIIISAYYANQDGDAALYVALNRNRFVYDHAGRRWYEFKKFFWSEDIIGNAIDSVNKVIQIYGEEAQRLYVTIITKEEDEDKKELVAKQHNCLLGRIRSLRTVYRKKAVIELAGYGPDSLGISGDEWDR